MLMLQVNAFIDDLEQHRQYAANTILAYRNDLSQLATYIGTDSQWTEVDRALLDEYIEQLRSRKYAPATIARKIAAIKKFLAYLQNEGEVTNDLGHGIDPPRVDVTHSTLLTAEEIERILNLPIIPSNPKTLRNRCILNLLYATDVRISRLVELRIEDYQDGVLLNTPLDANTAEIFKAYVTEARPILLRMNLNEKSLFLNHRGSRLTRQGVWLIIKKAATEVGIVPQVTPRLLRRSFAAYRQEHKPPLV